MISGYFLLNRGDIDANYSFHKINGVIRIVLCWDTIIIALKLVKQLLFNKETTVGLLAIPVECMKSLVQKGYMWQFWYLGALLILYILYPAILRFSRKAKHVLMLSVGIIAVALEAISIILGNSVQAKVIQTFRIWTWIFYFILGSEMSKITEIIILKIGVKLHIFMVIAITIINIAYQNYAGIYLIAPDIGTRLHAEYFYDSLVEMIWIISLFTLLHRVNISDSIRAVVEKATSLTMGIYIIHPLLMRITVKIIGNTSLIRAAIYWIVTLFGAALTTWMIGKTSLRKYLLKL